MKPILFNTEMARAILDDRKTVTRRLLKPRYRDDECGFQIVTNAHDGKFLRVEKLSDQGSGIFPDGSERYVRPPYKPGDILYVRETWRVQSAHRFEADVKIEFRTGGQMSKIQFSGRCSDSHERHSYDQFISKWGVGSKWHPSIFMPKEAARTFLRVTDVRVEQLQYITDDQCMNEGIQQWSKDGKLYKYAPADHEGDYPMWPWQEVPLKPRGAFVKLWDSTIKKEDLPTYGFAANPWVWVIEFERISKEEATKC